MAKVIVAKVAPTYTLELSEIEAKILMTVLAYISTEGKRGGISYTIFRELHDNKVEPLYYVPGAKLIKLED